MAIIFAAGEGFLDSVKENKIKQYEKEYHDFLSSRHKEILESIKKEKKITDTTRKKLLQALEEFKVVFSKEGAVKL